MRVDRAARGPGGPGCIDDEGCRIVAIAAAVVAVFAVLAAHVLAISVGAGRAQRHTERLEHRGRSRIDHHGMRARVSEHVRELGCRQPRVERHRDQPGPRRAEERHEERRRVGIGQEVIHLQLGQRRAQILLNRADQLHRADRVEEPDERSASCTEPRVRWITASMRGRSTWSLSGAGAAPSCSGSVVNTCAGLRNDLNSRACPMGRRQTACRARPSVQPAARAGTRGSGSASASAARRALPSPAAEG